MIWFILSNFVIINLLPGKIPEYVSVLPVQFSPVKFTPIESILFPTVVIVPRPDEEIVRLEDLLPLILAKPKSIPLGAAPPDAPYLAKISPQGLLKDWHL